MFLRYRFHVGFMSVSWAWNHTGFMSVSWAWNHGVRRRAGFMPGFMVGFMFGVPSLQYARPPRKRKKKERWMPAPSAKKPTASRCTVVSCRFHALWLHFVGCHWLPFQICVDFRPIDAREAAGILVSACRLTGVFLRRWTHAGSMRAPFEVDSGGSPNPDFTYVSDVCFRRVFQTPVSDMFQTSVSDPGFRPWFQTDFQCV